VPYRNASGTWTTAPLTSFGRGFLALADAAAARAALSLVVGTNVQAHSAHLTGMATLLASLSGSVVQLLSYLPGTDTWASVASAGWGRSVLAVNSAASMNQQLITGRVDANTGATVSYTAALTDSQNLITTNNASANKIMIPTHAAVAFPTWSIITGLQLGAGQTSFEAVTPGTTTVHAPDGAKISGQYRYGSAQKIANDEWVLFGALTT